MTDAAEGTAGAVEPAPLVLLLATDGSDDAALARRAAVDLAGRTGWPLHVVYAWQVPVALYRYHEHTPPPRYRGLFRQRGRAILERERTRVEADRGAVADTHIIEARPADGILRAADELGAGLVILGSRGLGRVRRLVLGSVAEEVVHLSHRPVLVMRGGADAWPPRRIVVGDDGSPEAGAAARLAGRLASTLEVPLDLVEVIPHLDEQFLDDPTISVDALLSAARVRVDDHAAQITAVTGARVVPRLVMDHPVVGILDTAEGEGDRAVLVTGSRGAGLMQRMLMGSVSSRLLHAFHGPMLIVPRPGAIGRAPADT